MGCEKARSRTMLADNLYMGAILYVQALNNWIEVILVSLFWDSKCRPPKPDIFKFILIRDRGGYNDLGGRWSSLGWARFFLIGHGKFLFKNAAVSGMAGVFEVAFEFRD